MGQPPAPEPSPKVNFAAGWQGGAAAIPHLASVARRHRGQGPPHPMNSGFALSGSGSIPPDATTAPPTATMPVIRPLAPLESPEGPP